ncbi:MAG: hypothetical protein CW691_06125 [Candidatus Bathyarchaeum sp.]|nr:MAG: hypothetical protein CW691_06125 [Candidatus Bathyarchaeum sp.]
MKEKDELQAFGELKGNTLLVYLYLVRHPNPVGAREIQRNLDFSSPTLAVYHLEKLCNLELVHKNPDGYVLAKEVKIGALSQVIKFGSFILPRYIFYTAFFSILLLCYVAFLWTSSSLEFTIRSSYAILVSLAIIAVMFYECIRIWKQRPI